MWIWFAKWKCENKSTISEDISASRWFFVFQYFDFNSIIWLIRRFYSEFFITKITQRVQKLRIRLFDVKLIFRDRINVHIRSFQAPNEVTANFEASINQYASRSIEEIKSPTNPVQKTPPRSPSAWRRATVRQAVPSSGVEEGFSGEETEDVVSNSESYDFRINKAVTAAMTGPIVREPNLFSWIRGEDACQIG